MTAGLVATESRLKIPFGSAGYRLQPKSRIVATKIWSDPIMAKKSKKKAPAKKVAKKATKSAAKKGPAKSAKRGKSAAKKK